MNQENKLRHPRLNIWRRFVTPPASIMDGAAEPCHGMSEPRISVESIVAYLHANVIPVRALPVNLTEIPPYTRASRHVFFVLCSIWGRQ